MTPPLRRVLRRIALRVLAAARRLAGDRNGQGHFNWDSK